MLQAAQAGGASIVHSSRFNFVHYWGMAGPSISHQQGVTSLLSRFTMGSQVYQ